MFSANMRSQQALMERDKTLEEMTMSFEHRLRMSEDQREQELSALQARATRTVQKNAGGPQTGDTTPHSRSGARRITDASRAQTQCGAPGHHQQPSL
mmetsp:Transcript_26122/g.55529  ORF Transcript_26122/g.55529 Transcript_26122/m.55529 type:complete len:97 (-) Transcript_26122:1292-1582(-)